MKFDKMAVLIAATAVLSAASLILLRRSEFETSIVLYSTAAVLLIAIFWMFWKRSRALRRWPMLAAVAVWYGDEFLVHMMRKPDFSAIFRWGILFVGYALLSFFWLRDKQSEISA